MKPKLKCFALLIFLLAAAVAASGQTAWYPVVEKDTPTPVDLVLYDEEPHSVIVQILNTTPWQIKFNPTPQSYNLPSGDAVAHLKNTAASDTADRHAQKSFLFAPVGVPNTIPGIPVRFFPELCGNNCAAQGETYPGRPYSMVFAWDDLGGDVKYSSVYWTIKGVQYCINDCNNIADVPVGLYMTRISPPKKLVSDYIKAVINIVKLVVDTAKFVTGDWMAFFDITADFKDGAANATFIANQQKESDGTKMYVSAFPPPDVLSDCYTTPSDTKCYPSAMQADDGTDAEWGNGMGGPAAAAIVVTTHVMRGTSPSLGTLPVVMITVMRWQDYWYAQLNDAATNLSLRTPGAGGVALRPEVRAIVDQLRHLLNKHGLAGSDALKVAVAAVPADQRPKLRAVILSLRSGQDITNAQRQFLHSLVVNLRLLLNEKEEG